MEKKVSISDFSKHLFWDINRNELDFEKNKRTIIKNVLEYGLIDDWKIIYKLYGIDEIAQTVMKLKYLDKKSIAFISVLSKIPQEKFLCYTMKQLTPKHWEF